jgi:hypothetical protein
MINQEIQTAIATLKGSERGTDCLAEFIAIARGRANGLDCHGWHALAILSDAMAESTDQEIEIIDAASS